MNELLSQLITPEVQMAFTVLMGMLVVLYVLVVVWVARDANQRGAVWWIWAIVALIPIVGFIAYLLMRPSLLEVDREEQELEIAIKQRQLMKYGECAKCGYPVEADYVICPNCLSRLKNLCMNCGHALEPGWSVCPYCATQVGGQRRQGGQARTRTAQQPPREAASE